MRSIIRFFFKVIQIKIIYSLFNFFAILKKKKSTKLFKDSLVNLKISGQEYKNCTASLNNLGYFKYRNLVDKDILKKIKEKFDFLFNNNINYFFYDIHPSIDLNQNINIELNSRNISNYTNYVMLKNPALYIPEILELINDDISKTLLDYFKVIPSLTHINLKRSFKNNLPPMGQNFYHRDENGKNFLKAFIYLNDVNLENGPFVYIKESHKNIPVKSFYKYSYSEDEIIKQNLKQNKIYATANYGDMIFANTRGLHKGSQILNGHRDMITFHFCLHYEYFRKSTELVLPKNFSIPANYKKIYFEHSNISKI